MKDPNESSSGQEGPRRVLALVALRLLEVIRDRDLPGEILKDEDPTRTMPRRFGLSDVVDRQIRAYKADVRKRVRLSDAEVGDLFRLVIRRPDADEVFDQVGRLLASSERGRRLSRVLPERAKFALSRSAAKRRLKRLFGRTIGGFGRGPFVIEGRSLYFIRHDPGGDACHLISGFCSEVIQQVTGVTVRVEHDLCQARGDELCRWRARIVREPMAAETPSSGTHAGAGAQVQDEEGVTK